MQNSSYKILIVDDEAVQRETLCKILNLSGFNTTTAASAEDCIQQLKLNTADLVVTDLRMPGQSGIQLAKSIETEFPETKVIVLTAFADVDSAIESMRIGVIDYFMKPVDVDQLIIKINTIQANTASVCKTPALRRVLNYHDVQNDLIGSSEKIRDIKLLITQVADSRGTVLISGESGSGKEVVARRLHILSSRSRKEFVAVNCSAIPETLLESELFGYKKGAFTGANTDKEGLFTKANGGTIFLDEIGEIPLSLQVKLLRAIQEREVYPLGSTKPVVLDIRIITATNKDLKSLCENGSFRHDLYYRLNVIEIKVPSLRERPEDIGEIARSLLSRLVKEMDSGPKNLSNRALRIISAHDWPGNVRELANALERAIIVTGKSELIDLQDLPPALTSSQPQDLSDHSLDSAIKRFSKHHIVETMKFCEGDKKKTAELLDVGLSSLYRKLDELEIQ